MPDNRPIGRPPSGQAPVPPSRRLIPPADPCAMVVFGAGGDMAKRLLIPALYNLSRTKVLPENFALIGVDLADGTAESWRDHLYDMLKTFVGDETAEFDIDRIDEAAWKRLAEKMSYIQGDLTKPELYEKIRGALGDAENAHDTQGNAIFYLAVADRFFGAAVEQLGKAKLTDQGEDKNGKPRFWRRVVIEKPFGHSLDSARQLNARILRTLHEDQIFRIDHFLGKDTVQSIMAFRFANGLFEPIWNRDRIDHVQITVAETVGVEFRSSWHSREYSVGTGLVESSQSTGSQYHRHGWRNRRIGRQKRRGNSRIAPVDASRSGVGQCARSLLQALSRIHPACRRSHFDNDRSEDDLQRRGA